VTREELISQEALLAKLSPLKKSVSQNPPQGTGENANQQSLCPWFDKQR